MAVSTTDVAKIAELARLHIEGEQLSKYSEQLNTILGHMEVLQKVDTNNVPEFRPGNPQMSLREDAVNPAPMRLSADGLTADARDGFILVPRLSTHEDV